MEKEIYLKRASARNFKGLENISYEFTDRETTLVGANGTGKSSFFAMFIWCLFGKDQFGRTDHQIKTLVDGKTDRYKDCEVELVLSVNGKETILKRVYAENWVRPKGRSEDEFKGNETKRYINDLELKASEYDMAVSEICNEGIFRVITNPSYFPNLKQDEQRAILFKMVGDISDESVAEGNKDFEEFLNMISGKSFETFKKEVSAKKKRLKSEVESIPARIDELNRSFPEPLNWSSIQSDIDGKKAELESIESQLNDASKLSEQENQRRMDLRNQINKLEEANQSIKFSFQREHNERIEAKRDEIRKLTLKEGEQNRDYHTKSSRLTFLENEKTRIEEMLQSLGSKWKKINGESLTFNDEEFECYACKRPLEIEDIEAKQNELKEEFNKNKSERLNRNVAEGKSRKAELDSINEEIQSIGKLQNVVDTSEWSNRIEEKKKELSKIQSETPDYENTLEYKQNLGEIAKLKSQLETPSSTDTSALKEQRFKILEEIELLNSDLSNKKIIDNTQKRIEELSALEQKINQEIADLERKEFLQKSFEFAKNESYEKKINEMFGLVQFNLFRQQVDGQIVPTCECHVEGVPYSTQNNAMQIAMGLDIINSISRYEGVYAPIFLDNRESVSKIPQVKAQIINLVVDSTEPVLRIS